MGCPVHIWAPIMGGMLPFARVARDRLRLFRATRAKAPGEQPAPPEMKRWAPIQSSAEPTAERSAE